MTHRDSSSGGSMRLFEGELGVHMDRPTTLFSREQLRAML